MKKIIIDGQEFEVPAERLTGNGLRGVAEVPEGNVIYWVRDGRHEVVPDDSDVEVEDGDRFGTLPRFISGSPSAGE
jgi:hypothetical protein